MFNVGLTGLNASGKGSVTDILKRLGYAYFSLSDLIREELQKNNLPLSRENLTRVGRELRVKFGPDVLAVRTQKKLSHNLNVIDSIRHPDEVSVFRKNKNFFLISVEAPAAMRFERAQMRGRNENAHTLAEFIEVEQREFSNNPNNQQLENTLKLADEVIVNDSSLEALEEKVLAALKKRNYPTH